MNHQLYHQALEQHRTGNLAEAELEYLKILQESPHDAETLHLLSILYAQKKDYLKARHYIERALVENQNSASFHNTLGNILKNLHEFPGAIFEYQKSFELDPNSPSSLNNLGNVYYLQHELDAAEQYYRKALTLNANYPDAHYNLALVLIKKKALAEAKTELITVINLEPKHAEAHTNLAQILQLAKNDDEALIHYQKAVRNNPENINAHHNLAVILTNKQKYGAALRHFKKVLLLDPRHPEALHNVGSLFLQQKDPDNALKYFLQLSTVLHDFDTFYNLGVIFLNRQRYREAVDYLEKSLEFDPLSVPARTNLAAIYLKQEDYQNAQKQYETIVQIDPNHQEASYLLSALTAETSHERKTATTAPKEYIESLFNNYAEHFEKHLKLLEYRVPELIFAAINNYLSPNHPAWKILDLGCGTGLMGAKLRAFAQTLIGIDLSPKMVELAKQKNLYDELRICSIDEALLIYQNLDLIVAADTYVYIGDLSTIFAASRIALKEKGWLIFTVEKTNQYPYLLQKSARFAHSLRYLEELAKEHSFTIHCLDNIILRKQKDTLIEGYLLVCQTEVFK